jgi:pimeloyl-ACP methyl ester carboxylesterase
MTTNCINMGINSTNVRIFRIRRQAVHAGLNGLWKWSPKLAEHIVRQASFAPSAYKTSAEEQAWLEKSSRFEILVRDKVIQGWKWGTGPGVLLVHGWNGRGIQLHRFIEPLLQDGHSVITYDGPGHGESEGRTTNYFELTDTVRGILNSVHGYSIHGVVGYSLGASAVLNGLEKENRELRTVLIAPALRLTEMLLRGFDDCGVPEPLYQKLIKELENEYGYDVQRDNPRNLLERMKTKMLIVHDKEDKRVPYAESQEVASRHENVALHTTEGLGHKDILVNESVVDLVVDYLYRISTRWVDE